MLSKQVSAQSLPCNDYWITGTLMMTILPYAQAPGMGLDSTFTVGISWQEAGNGVFVV